MKSPIIKHKTTKINRKSFDQELSESELEPLGSLDEVRYYYAYSSWEGSGLALLRRGTQWCLYDLGHCSCYGPTYCYSEEDNEWFQSLKELWLTCSSERQTRVKPLLEPYELSQLCCHS